MANNSESITYKITVDAELGVATVRNLKGQIVATKVPVQELRKEFGNFANTVDSVRFDKFKKGLDTATKSNQNLRTASGAATSSVMELGRVISDAPYGIRGMANNITQLVSQMGFAVKSTGSLKLALKEMWSALMGPLGIVLAITAAVSALDFFAGSQEKSKKETDKNTESLKKQITPLEKLINLYSSLKRVLFTSKDNEAINAFNNNFLSLDETVKVLTRNFSEFKNAYDKLSKDDKKNKESVKALVDGYSELLKLRELEEKQVSRMSVLRADVDKKGRTVSRNGLKFLREEAKELDNLETSYIKTQKRLIRLEDFFAKPDKEETKVIAKDFVETFYNEIAGIADVVADENFDEISDTAKITGKLILPFTPTFVEPEEEFYEKINRFIDNYKTLMSGVTDFIDGEFERELTIEQNRTNALNAQLNNRLINEKLSKDERQKIQNEIAKNDENLRVKQEAIARKQFNTTKAFNIAMATADTYMAAQKAYLSQLQLDPTSPIRAKIAAAVAVASGLARVAAISRTQFQSSSPSTPTRTSDSGGLGTTSERAEPSFNIVGRSNENLLINAIQAQFGKPLKAYVV